MTDEERAAWRQWKTDAVERVESCRALWERDYRHVLDATDGRLWAYLSGVMSEMNGHNLYEVLAVERFFMMLGRYGWNAGRVRRFFRFYEALRFNGTNGRTRYRLTPVQCFQFGNIFGLAREDGRRLIRTAYLFVPRKFGKTTSVASLAVYDLLFGDGNAQAYVAANSYNQAKVCFDEIRAIMRDIDPGEKHFRVNREAIFFKGVGRDSLARCLSANPKTLDGLNASLVIMDEYAQARDTKTKGGAELKNVLTSSMGARREPLTVILTTASEVIDGPFRHELDGAMSVLRGEASADTMFASIYMPDADDAEDDPRTWAKVQPHLGITVQPDFYQLEYETALLSAENMLAFRTKLLNVFAIDERKTWFSLQKAQELCSGFKIDSLDSRAVCAVAFDLSVRDDFSAVTYTCYLGGGRFGSHTEYYFPEGALKGHPNEQLYRQWHAEGHLIFCEGDRIDVRLIADDIIRRKGRLQIIRIGYDSYKSQELVNILSTSGASGVLTPYSQTYGSFNLPVETFEMLAYAAPPLIALNANPINVFCLTNCVIDEDTLENKKPVKAAGNRKIDGTITLLMTIGLLGSYKH